MGGDVSVPDEESEEPAGHGEDQSDDEDKENEPDEEGGDDDDDGGGGWITPGNIQRVQMDTADWTAPADVTVGCLTTDFAMQVWSAAVTMVMAHPLTRLVPTECLDPDGTARPVCGRATHPPGTTPCPALPRLLQVRTAAVYLEGVLRKTWF